MKDVDLALCAQTDPDLFFPESQQATLQIAQAKAICAECEIQKECLAEAMRFDFTEGIWGGTTPTERARLTRNLKALPYRLRYQEKARRNAKGDNQ